MTLESQLLRKVWRVQLYPAWASCWVCEDFIVLSNKDDSIATSKIQLCHPSSILFLLSFSTGGSQLQSSAPVNIPGSLSSPSPFRSPSPSPPIRAHHSPFLSAQLPQPSQSESSFLGTSHGSLGLCYFY